MNKGRSQGQEGSADCCLNAECFSLAVRAQVKPSPSLVVSLGLGDPKSIEYGVSRSCERKEEELEWAGVQERGAGRQGMTRTRASCHPAL